MTEDRSTPEQEAREAVSERYGPLCPECGVSWWEPSPYCPHLINNLHPLSA